MNDRRPVFQWSSKEFDYKVTFAGGHLGPHASFTRYPQGTHTLDLEKDLYKALDSDLFDKLLQELETKSGPRSEARVEPVDFKKATDKQVFELVKAAGIRSGKRDLVTKAIRNAQRTVSNSEQ